MAEPRILNIHLDPDLRASAQAGRHNFIAKIEAVMRGAGYDVRYRANSRTERLKSATRRGYSLFHMDPPLHDRALTFRRVYHYPFWAIEQTEKRWHWRVARTRFDPETVPRKRADGFYAQWQTRLFGDAPAQALAEGYVYIPLQGRLLDHRSFQTCTPLEMIEQVLQHDPARPVVAALHPKESYTARELDALDALAARHDRLHLETGQMERWLKGCDYVVTQNSAAGFSGYFFGKPLVLFGQIDFAHIARNVSDLGAEQAICTVMDSAPDFAGYTHWFWQKMSINAGRPDAEDRIARRFRQAGWPMEP